MCAKIYHIYHTETSKLHSFTYHNLLSSSNASFLSWQHFYNHLTYFCIKQYLMNSVLRTDNGYTVNSDFTEHLMQIGIGNQIILFKDIMMYVHCTLYLLQSTVDLLWFVMSIFFASQHGVLRFSFALVSFFTVTGSRRHII